MTATRWTSEEGGSMRSTLSSRGHARPRSRPALVRIAFLALPLALALTTDDVSILRNR